MREHIGQSACRYLRNHTLRKDMVTVRQSFIDSYLNNKLLEAVKSLNQVMDALDLTKEQKVVSEIDEIIKRILAIEI